MSNLPPGPSAAAQVSNIDLDQEVDLDKMYGYEKETFREGLIRNKKKKCELSHFWSGPPPPLKSVKCKIFFFFTHYLKLILVKRTFFPLINP